VRQVITIGTPFNASADHTNVGWIFRLLSGSAPRFDAALSARLRSAPAVPTTSIYSRTDGVVAWQTCRHQVESHRVQDLEVRGSHVGLGWNRSVLRIIGDRLAQPPGRWLRYEPDATGGAQGLPEAHSLGFVPLSRTDLCALAHRLKSAHVLRSPRV